VFHPKEPFESVVSGLLRLPGDITAEPFGTGLLGDNGYGTSNNKLRRHSDRSTHKDQRETASPSYITPLVLG
jgi:hypothetical protein